MTEIWVLATSDEHGIASSVYPTDKGAWNALRGYADPDDEAKDLDNDQFGQWVYDNTDISFRIELHLPLQRLTAELQMSYGGYWSEHPEFSAADWQAEIVNGDTRQGYWEWVIGKMNEN